MLAGHAPALMIDLNMLRGDRIRARRDFVEYGDVMPELSEGDVVHAFDEEGDVYTAIVESVEGVRVRLRLDLSSRTPTEDAWEVSMPYSAPLEPVVVGTRTVELPKAPVGPST